MRTGLDAKHSSSINPVKFPVGGNQSTLENLRIVRLTLSCKSVLIRRTIIYPFIIIMTKLLDADWLLRGVQLFH